MNKIILLAICIFAIVTTSKSQCNLMADKSRICDGETITFTSNAIAALYFVDENNDMTYNPNEMSAFQNGTFVWDVNDLVPLFPSGDVTVCVEDIPFRNSSVNCGVECIVIKVDTALIITQPVIPETVCAGAAAVFSVDAQPGPLNGVLTYQWFENTGAGPVVMPGETNSDLVLPFVNIGMDGNLYSVEITETNSTCNSVMSSEELLTIFQNAVSISIDQNAICNGDMIELSSNGTNINFFLDENLNGFNDVELSLGGGNPQSFAWNIGAGEYSICVEDLDFGCILCTDLQVYNELVVSQDIFDLEICENEDVTFIVDYSVLLDNNNNLSSGCGPMDCAVSYQWYTAPPGSSTFTTMPGETNATLTVTGATSADNGTQYQVELLQNQSPCNATLSSVATLMVNPGLFTASHLFYDLPSNAQFLDVQGDPSNQNYTVGNSTLILADITGIGWDLTITPIGASKYSDANFNFNGAVTIAPGSGDNSSGNGVSKNFAADIIKMESLGLSFQLGNPGLMNVELFDADDDFPNAADADVSGTILFEVGGCGITNCLDTQINYTGPLSIRDQTKDKVSDMITVDGSMGTVQVLAGDNVELKAGNNVTVITNFETILGAEFLMDIEACIDGP